MSEPSTEELVQIVRSGNQESYAVIIQRYQQALYVYCYHLLMQREEAEDAVQDVLIKAYEKLGMYAYKQSFSAWLYKMAYNHCMNLLHKRKRAKLMYRLLGPLREGRADEGYDLTRKKEIRELSEQVLLRLTPDERVLILLRVIEGRSYEDIQEQLPFSASALRKKAERAKRKLKKAWIELEGCEDEYRQGMEPSVGNQIP